MTGSIVIDYKGDRIMDYQVWYLASDSDKFTGYMKIPLTKAGRNTTVCVEWLVNNKCNPYFNVYRIITIIILLLYFIVTFNIFILCFLRINVLINASMQGRLSPL